MGEEVVDSIEYTLLLYYTILLLNSNFNGFHVFRGTYCIKRVHVVSQIGRRDGEVKYYYVRDHMVNYEKNR